MFQVRNDIMTLAFMLHVYTFPIFEITSSSSFLPTISSIITAAFIFTVPWTLHFYSHFLQGITYTLEASEVMDKPIPFSAEQSLLPRNKHKSWSRLLHIKLSTSLLRVTEQF